MISELCQIMWYFARCQFRQQWVNSGNSHKCVTVSFFISCWNCWLFNWVWSYHSAQDADDLRLSHQLLKPSARPVEEKIPLQNFLGSNRYTLQSLFYLENSDRLSRQINTTSIGSTFYLNPFCTQLIMVSIVEIERYLHGCYQLIRYNSHTVVNLPIKRMGLWRLFKGFM